MLKINVASVKRSLVLLLAIVVVVSTGQAQTPVPYAEPQKHQGPVFKDRRPGVLVTRMWDWTTGPWNGDNAPYHQARLGIDQAAEAGQGLDGLLAKCKARAQRNPDDALAAFRWAYTAYQIMLEASTNIAQHEALDGVEEALRQADSPHTYDYARIQFLVGEFYTAHHQAVPVAKRILAVDQNDYQVAYCLASIYLDDYVHPRIEDALSICDHLKQLYPAKSSLYTLSGEAYVLWWYEDKQSSHAQGVIDNYEKYLQLAPPKDEFRKRAQSIISEFKVKLKS